MRRHVLSLLNIVLIYIGLAVFCPDGATQAFQFLDPQLKKGDFSVGYKRATINDFSATAAPRFDYQGNQIEQKHYRTVPVSYWYPSKDGTGSEQTLRNYVYSYAPGKGTDEITDIDRQKAIENFNGYPLQQGAKEEDLANLLSSPVVAKKNAQPINQRFPLIVIPGGFYANFFVAPTAEFLASHGYVVAYINDSASTGIAGYANEKDLLWRLADLKLAINYLAQKPFVQWNNIGVWGYHSGGSVGALLQMQSDNVRGVVSVEGSEGWTRESTGYPLLSKNSLYDPARARVPYLRFQSLKAEPDWYISTPDKTTWAFYEQAKYADVYRIILADSEHDDMGDGVRNKVAPGKASAHNVEQRLLLNYGLAFFKSTLSQDRHALKAIREQPQFFGFEQDFAKLEFKAALPRPPAKHDLRREFEVGGIDALRNMVIENLKGENPSINTKLLGDLAQDFVWAEKQEEKGLQIVKVATELFPDDYWGPYLAGVIYNRIKDYKNKRHFYTLAKQRLLDDKTFDQAQKETRLDRINKALEL
ncbi:acyl-CoA thioester hydrolase/BAAT C-terminal domain-containing protein [Aliikangiella sp. G2MR2-5]|uniref:acyl-CoA thioester hydrolase/BAAT C-terminal domain-containing protein n=1 Tax=Aliikangiella sp. G2MR2-5 TaxID=2788943 RepID=UPI0018A8932A|nr:acyl-CoA thioester hydrolase/BAAT C-terminal domain-containing protein [Aliikangiella sp. G2MR2-5]